MIEYAKCSSNCLDVSTATQLTTIFHVKVLRRASKIFEISFAQDYLLALVTLLTFLSHVFCSCRFLNDEKMNFIKLENRCIFIFFKKGGLLL